MTPESEADAWKVRVAPSLGLTPGEALLTPIDDLHDALRQRVDELNAEHELDVATVRVLGSPAMNTAVDDALRRAGRLP